MSFDRYGPVPRYRQIAQILRARIESGQYSPNRPIPSEAELMAEFSVARMTVRHAVQVLKEQGLVVTVPGLGTYVKRREK